MLEGLRSDVAQIAAFGRALRSYWTGPFKSSDPAFANAIGAGPTSQGLSITPDSALNSSAFWSAVAIIAGDVASLPLELFKRDKDGNNEPFVGSKTYELVHDNPNPEMTSMVMREAIQAHTLTWGGGYAEIERTGVGQPLALWPITPDRVTPFRNGTAGYPTQLAPTGAVYYRVTNANKPDVYLPAADMLHVPGLGFDGLVGYSVIEKARDSIGMGLAMQRFGGSFFGNGSTFGGVLSHPANLTKEVKQSIRESIDAVHTGVDRAHKFIIVGGGMKYEKLGIPPNDAQFLESRRFEIEEIARWFHMPQHKLNGLDHATFSNIEHLDLEYFKSCLRGWLVRWEQELNRKLIPPLERKSQYFKHNVEGFLRGDSVARADYQVKMFGVGSMTINEMRELNNQNGIGPDGDTHFVPANLMPVDRALRPPPPHNNSNNNNNDQQQNAHEDLLLEIATNTKALQESLTAQRDATTQEERDEQTALIVALRAEGEQFRVELLELRSTADKLSRDAAMQRESATAAEAAREVAEAARVAAVERQNLIESDYQRVCGEKRDACERLEAEAAARVAAETAATAQRTAEHDRLTGMLAAHRALIVDAMGRMVRRETEKARRHQATPDKLRAWAESFYLTHEDVCIDALRPAIRVHLAWRQSTDDVDEVAGTFVREHIAESLKYLRAVADGDPEDLSARLERLLTRWESQRADALADRVLAEEIAYVRTH